MAFLKKILAVFFIWFIYKPLFYLSRMVFYKVIVRVYGLVRSFLRRYGWSGLDHNVFSFLFNQKLVHITVAVITVLLLIINLTPRASRAQGFNEKANQTILSQLIQSEFGSLGEDEQLIIETFDREAAISNVQQSYLDNLSSFRPQPRVSLEEIEEETELSTVQGGGSIVKPELAATEKTVRPRTETVEYTVQPGDTISTIAQAYGVSVNTILWENGKTSYSIIRPGDTLRVLPMTGVSHSVQKGDNLTAIAKKYGVEEEKILEANKIAQGDTLKIGQKLLVPEGRKVSSPQYAPKTYTGFTAIKDIVTTQDAAPVSGNKMNWPTVAGRITQYYSWRHHGLDIADKLGTAIYASDAGTIEYAGWGQGYGNQIVIDHGGGKKTRYAHLSKFYSEKGDTVKKGQTIAAMGSTGWSTGSHVHFEVIINNAKQNPLNYIR